MINANQAPVVLAEQVMLHQADVPGVMLARVALQ
jgi:hypothetical protein